MLKLIGIKEDIIAEITHKLLTENNPTNLSDHLIIFPTKRMGVFLRDKLSKTINRPYFPPRIDTINNFISSLFDLNFPGFWDIDEIRGSFILYLLVKKRFGDNFYTINKKGSTFLEFYPWALKLFTGVEKILIESRNITELNQNKFREFIQLGDYFKSYKQFIVELPALVKEYTDVLLSKKVKTRGLMYQKIAELSRTANIKVVEYDEYIFAGFNALNFSESAILKYCYVNLNSWILFRTDTAALNNSSSPFVLQKQTINMFDDTVNFSNFNKKEEWNRFFDKVKLYGCVNVETQMQNIYYIIKDILNCDSKIELEKIGIVLADPASLIPFLQGVVSRFNQDQDKIPFNITLGYPFLRTPLYQLIDFILKIGESRKGKLLYYKDYLALLRHPYVKTSADSLLIKGIHYLEDIINRDNLVYFEVGDLIKNRLKRMLDKKENSGLAQEIIQEVEKVHKYFLIEDNVSFRNLCEFLLNALYFVKDIKGGKSYLFLEEYILTAVNCIDELIDFFKEEKEHFLIEQFSLFAEFIRYSFSRKKINFYGSPLKGIQVMGMLEFRGLKFDRIIVVDANEGILPQLVKYDPLLPYDVQRLFTIRTYTDWEKLFAFNFFSVIAASSKAHVLWTEKRGKLGKKEKSRFIQRICYETEKIRREVTTINKKVNLKIEKPGLKKVYKDAAILKKLDSLEFSPSSIETYIRCPLRFYFQKILKLLEKEEVSPEPDAAEFGSVIHEILSVFYSKVHQYIPLDNNNLLELEKNLQDLINQKFLSWNFDINSGIIKIRLWAVLKKLTDFMKYDLERMTRNSIDIMGLEKEVASKYFPVDLDKQVVLKGIIDRVEKEGDVYRIIDYKTGGYFSTGISDLHYDRCIYKMKGADYTSGLNRFLKKYKSLQLLIYAKLYNELFVKDYKKIDASYVFLRKPPGLAKVFKNGKKEFSDQEKEDIMLEFDKGLSSIFKDIFTRSEFIPNPSDETYCSYCPYIVPCGNV